MAIRMSYFLGETLSNLRRNLLLTLAAISTAALSLFLLGGVMVGGKIIDKMLTSWEGKVELNVFLREEITPEQSKELGSAISSMPEVAKVFYESKDQAFNEYKKMFEDTPAIWQNVDPNALPASYRIKLKDPNTAQAVASRLEGRPGVDEVQYGGKAVKRLLRLIGVVRTGVLIATSILLGAAILLIANTIRLAVYARRKEIGIMKLVGATNWFIRVPFILEGMVAAAIGSILAASIILAGKMLVLDQFQRDILFLPVTVGTDVVLQVFATLLVVGLAIGAIGSTVALRRFLEV